MSQKKRATVEKVTKKKKRRIWTSLLLQKINRPQPILPIDSQINWGQLDLDLPRSWVLKEFLRI
jgi:hypothetical protein